MSKLTREQRMILDSWCPEFYTDWELHKGYELMKLAYDEMGLFPPEEDDKNVLLFIGFMQGYKARNIKLDIQLQRLSSNLITCRDIYGEDY